ncbi:conserved hypothetical protein [Burkholderia pseudomallei 576]|nr:conserved hypothetical protein [Burkholderia pseudomallei 576]
MSRHARRMGRRLRAAGAQARAAASGSVDTRPSAMLGRIAIFQSPACAAPIF